MEDRLNLKSNDSPRTALKYEDLMNKEKEQ